MFSFLINESKYPELLLLCGHDTHHDFFENMDPIKKLFSEHSGGSREHWRVGGLTRQGTPYLLNAFITSLTHEDFVSFLDHDYNSYTAISENNIINNEPINEIRNRDFIQDFIQKINTLYQRPVKDIDFFPQTIREDDMTPEDKRIEAAVLYGTKNITKPRPGVKRDRTIRKIRKKKKGSNTSRAMKNTIKELTDILEGKTGGALRRSSRGNILRADIKRKLEELRGSLITIMNKIRIWDGYVFKVRAQPQFYPSDKKYNDLHIINEELRQMDDSVKMEDSLFLFCEWIKLKGSTSSQLLNGRSKILNDEILEYIYKDSEESNTFDSLFSEESNNTPEYLSKIYFGFYTIFEKLLNEEMKIERLEELFLDLKRFTIYTSANGINDVDIDPKDFSININTFVKKKWIKYLPIRPSTVAGTGINNNLLLINNFITQENITLTTEEQNNIKTLKYEIMKWWVNNSGISSMGSISEWAEKQKRRMDGGSDGKGIDVESITDLSLRDDFLEYEFDIKKNRTKGRGPSWKGFYKYNSSANTTEKTPNVHDTIKDISINAYSNNAFGNNASSTKLYSKDDSWKRMATQGLSGPIMESKDHYDCNTVNVADPAPTCPTCLKSCENVDITVKSTTGEDKILFKITPGNKALTYNSSLEYMIILPGAVDSDGEVLQGGIDPSRSINRIHSGKKIEGLSKTSVLQEVFNKMGAGSYSDILDSYIKSPHSIKDIIEIFCLKLFGDFGQELYSVCQSFNTPSVYIGNDWISYIRYLFLKKYSTNNNQNKRKMNTFYPWYGGFLGNKDFNIIYQYTSSSPPSTPTSSPKRPRQGGGKKIKNKLPQLRILTYKNKKHKYRLSDTQTKRRKALDAGIKTEQRKTKKKIKKAAIAKKARLNVLRIYRKNNNPKECRKLTQDMKYIDKKYQLGETKDICKNTRKDRRKTMRKKIKKKKGRGK